MIGFDRLLLLLSKTDRVGELLDDAELLNPLLVASTRAVDKQRSTAIRADMRTAIRVRNDQHVRLYLLIVLNSPKKSQPARRSRLIAFVFRRRPGALRKRLGSSVQAPAPLSRSIVT